MFRILFTAILFIHGFIHVFGFIKGFSLFETPSLSQPVTRFHGALWLLVTLSFIATGILFVMRKEWWWLLALLSIFLSQYLIITSWHDAKVGTLANVVILLAAIVGFGEWNFMKSYKLQVKLGNERIISAPTSLLTEADIRELPDAVKNYIRYTGALNKNKVRSFKIKMDGQLRKSTNSEWMSFSSVQNNFTEQPTRLFWMKANMKMLPVTGFHKYGVGNTFMDIRLLSLFNVEYQTGNDMAIAETVTYFNDMCIFAPAALIDKKITWKELDSLNIQATFVNQNISITAILTFNEKYELINFVSDDRYFSSGLNEMKKVSWSTPVKSYQKLNGRQAPSFAEAIWHFEDSTLCYGKFQVKEIEYN